jgi:hypothetical protein
MIQRRIVLGVVLGAAAIVVIGAAQLFAQSREACANPDAKAELRLATRSLDDAAYDLQAAISGGSLYAAAKVAAADPVEVERAAARQRQAFERVMRARAACRDQVAA